MRLEKKIVVGYVDPYTEFKGFDEYLKLVRMLKNKQIDNMSVEFHVFGDNRNIKLPDDVINHGKVESEKIADIYKNIDVLIVPRKWKETFGFITAEALSFGVKTFVGQNVGAKDLVEADAVF